jgi:hypothetical protein
MQDVKESRLVKAIIKTGLTAPLWHCADVSRTSIEVKCLQCFELRPSSRFVRGRDPNCQVLLPVRSGDISTFQSRFVSTRVPDCGSLVPFAVQKVMHCHSFLSIMDQLHLRYSIQHLRATTLIVCGVVRDCQTPCCIARRSSIQYLAVKIAHKLWRYDN